MGIERRKVSSFTMDHMAIWLTIGLAITTYSTPASSAEPRVVCYYTNWSVYRPGTARFNPQNINPYLCTHLIYAFGGFTKDNAFKPFDKYQDIEKGGYAKFTGLKTYNKNLKTMLAIGGWNEGSSRFSPMVASKERRKEFVRNAIKFLRQNRFDGLDLDWEYPAFRDGGKPKDRENYAKLVRELREEFERESQKTGRPRLLLTMAVPAGIEYIHKGFDVKTLNEHLDWMNLLTYDYHSAFEPAVNHHAPLYPLEEPNEYSVDNELNIDYTIKYYLENGADRDKLVLGIPTYGRSYTLFNSDATEIGAPADGPGEQGDATREKGYLAYYEICEALKAKEKKRNVDSDDEDSDEDEEEEDKPWTVIHPNSNAMGPVAYKGNQWVGYDDIDIVKKKAEYVADNGLGGIMFWSIDNDDFRGTCHGKPYPLIESAKEAYIGALGSTDNVVVTERPRPADTTRRRSRPRGSSTTTERPTQAAKLQTNKRKNTSATLTTPTWNIITPEPPTTPDPGSDFKCTDEGFFQHPRDCKKYFWCLDSGPSNLGIVAHQFTCPSGLFFNKASDSCDFARNVICKKPTTTTAAPTIKALTTKASTTEAYTTTSTTRRPIKLSTKSSTLFRTTTTTTTTPEPEFDEDINENESADIEAQDPKVIKELIDLIKKVGGVEQLEKQLHLSETPAASDGDVTTTRSPFNKKLYQKVLERTRANKFTGNSLSDGISQNSRRAPQNAGLDEDFSDNEEKSSRKDRPQYTTINRSRQGSTTPEPDEADPEPDSAEQPAPPLPQVQSPPAGSRARSAAGSSTSKPLQYVNIRRTRPKTTSDTPDDSASRNALFERSEAYASDTDSPDTSVVTGGRRENALDYVTIRRQRPTEEATTTQYQITEHDESIFETIVEKEISSPPSLQPQYTSIERRRPTTTTTTTPTPSETPGSPEPTTVLAVQISSLLNAPSFDDEVEEVTEASATTVTTHPPPTASSTASSTLPPRRVASRRRATTTTATPTTSTQASKVRLNNFRRRTKATAPPIDTTEPTIDTIVDNTTLTNNSARRGNSKFKTQNEKESKTKEVEKDADRKEGGKIEIAARQPSLNGANARRSERPANRTYVRRRNGGASTTTSPAVGVTTSSPARRLYHVGKRRRPVTNHTSSVETTLATTETSKETTAITTPSTTSTLASEEELQEIDVRESIEDPTLLSRKSPALRKTVKIQRRPLTSLKEPLDLNPSATNEDKNGQTKDPPKKDEERKRQSKKYSSNFKQNQLDEVIRQKSKSEEELDSTTQGTTDGYSAETAVAIAAHQLLSAPLPLEDSFADQANTKSKKVTLKPTTRDFEYFFDPDYHLQDTTSHRPVYRGSTYSTIDEDYGSPAYPSTVIPISGYSSGISKTSGYSSTPSYSSTSKLPSLAAQQRPSGFTTAGFLSGGFSISPALGPSTARYSESRDKLVGVPVEDYGYAAMVNRDESYFTREYLLESPITKTYDDKYQYLLPETTPQSVNKKLPRKTFYRKISTTIGPDKSRPSSTGKLPRLAQRTPFEKVTKAAPNLSSSTYRSIDNYDYYDDTDEKLSSKFESGDKVFVDDKGLITCRDMGNFAHPTSCKKFISCSRQEGGAFIGWEYVCPVGLSFDPVGGICNWSAGLGCTENE